MAGLGLGLPRAKTRPAPGTRRSPRSRTRGRQQLHVQHPPPAQQEGGLGAQTALHRGRRERERHTGGRRVQEERADSEGIRKTHHQSASLTNGPANPRILVWAFAS